MAPLVLLIVTRPVVDQPTVECDRLLRSARLRLTLSPLGRHETDELVRRRLEIDALPSDIAELIWNQTQGRPFYAEELTLALREQGLISIESGACHASSDALGSLVLPDSVQGIVASRLDSLDPQALLALKAASVLGIAFDLRALRAVHPMRPEESELAEQMTTIQRQQLVYEDNSTSPPAFRFAHAITHDVTYGLMPFDQRRALHRAAATWLELELASVEHKDFALLAHHWQAADMPGKALKYLDLAATEASRQFANQEVVRFLGQAVKLVDGVNDDGDEPPVQLTAWRRIRASQATQCRRERQLGEALLNLGHYESGSANLERVLTILRCPLPRGSSLLMPRLLRQLALQWRLRALGWSVGHYAATTTAPYMLEATRAYTRLAGANYHVNRGLRVVLCLLSASNIAERCGAAAESAVAFAQLAMAAGAVGVHRLARRYARLANDTAVASQDSQCQALVLCRTSIYRLAVGDWDALDALRRSIEHADKVGNSVQWEESSYILALGLVRLGRFEQARDVSEAVLRSSSRSSALLHQIWGLRAVAEAQLGLGQLDAAMTSCHQARSLLKEEADANSAIQVGSLLAQAELRSGEDDAARRTAEATLELISHTSFTGYNSVPWYAGLAEVFLHLWEAHRRDSDAKKAQRVCRTLSLRARRHRPSRAQACCGRGGANS